MGISFVPTLVISLRSLGTFFVLVLAGFILKKANKFSDELSKGLAEISLNVTIPCLLFVDMLNCDQNFSAAACPSLLATMRQGWILLFWPIIVVGVGILLAHALVLPFGGVATNFRRTAIVAVAFGNSTGLPVTLLTAIRNSFPPTSPIGLVDPVGLLAVYLVLYPVLQWGLGGYLMGIRREPKRRVHHDDRLSSAVSVISSSDSPPAVADDNMLLLTEGTFAAGATAQPLDVPLAEYEPSAADAAKSDAKPVHQEAGLRDDGGRVTTMIAVGRVVIDQLLQPPVS
jgi:predicted permease